MGKKRELGFLNKVFSQYKGQYNGWWSDQTKLIKCDTKSGKPKENGEIKEGGRWVCLENLGILEGERAWIPRRRRRVFWMTKER